LLPFYQGMRKVVITMDTTLIRKIVPPHFFEILEYMEGKAILKIDIEKGVKIAVCDLKVRDGFTLDNIEIPDEWKILDVLKENNNIYTCLLKTEYKKGLKVKQLFSEEYYEGIRQLFGLDIIFDLPFMLTEEKAVVSFVVNNEIMKQFMKAMSQWGNIMNISFQPPTFSDYSVLSCLTERQKEVITTAKESGYYEVPRRTSSKELSQKLGISRATTIEHLRKAEHRLISSILAGYE
jgi:DNA-binding CsgD family transcriptional regulator